jgi:4-amino-4-deoxy-L-arabinose transferase-like glycosyltransferase
VILESVQDTSTMQQGRQEARWTARLLLAVSAVFLLAGFMHLRADFPNGSPWSDWAKMTDEGWYGSAAIQHFLWGSWYLPGSFNPAVAMPVWPAMLGGWFAITGVGMLSARVLTMLLYTASAGLLYVLMRQVSGRVCSALAVLLTVANPLCYAFDRLAVLEPVNVFWMMLGFWLAATARRGAGRGIEVGRALLLGGLICLQVLTKATGVALVPAVLYLYWASLPGVRAAVARVWPVVLAGVTAALLWAGYFVLCVKPHYLADYHLLFTINDYRAHLSILPKMAWVTLRDGLWLQAVVFPAALLIVVLSAKWLRSLWHTPLFVAAVLAAAGHLAYIGYHTNFQPRYYLVVAMPISIIVALGLRAVWEAAANRGGRLALTGGVAAALIWMGSSTVHYASHPDYSFLTAAQSIAVILRADGGPRPVLLSDSGADIALFTGVSAIDEGYSTGGLDAVLGRYHPGWYAAWSGWEDKSIAQVALRYRLDEVARYRVFDDPTRQVLVLYKLSPRKP